MNKLIELRDWVPNDAMDQLEALLYEEVHASPWIIEQVRPNEPHQLAGYFTDFAEATAQWETLASSITGLSRRPQRREIIEQDWQDSYKAYLKPWVSRGLHWVPVWERNRYTIPAGDVAVWVDAGMAFGTGTHETTQLCAERLLDFVEDKDSHGRHHSIVIDAGCGSGILALSAYRLGCRRIRGFDIDPEAVRISQRNSKINDIALDKQTFFTADLVAGLDTTADLVLANILAPVLCANADHLLQALAAQGTLVLSGILATERQTVRKHFETRMQKLFRVKYTINSRTLGEWADLCIRRH